MAGDSVPIGYGHPPGARRKDFKRQSDFALKAGPLGRCCWLRLSSCFTGDIEQLGYTPERSIRGHEALP